MKKNKESWKILVSARKALDELWKEAHLKGRCWGPRMDGNPYQASNITIAVGAELISISQCRKTGALVIHQFVKTKDTVLGKMVKKVLTKNHLRIKRT